MTAPTLVYFGDSLSDDGNLYAYGAGILPDEIRDAIAGPTNAVSDGPTHATYTAELLGAEAANYAVAAAEALGSQTLEQLVIDSGFEDDLLIPVTDPALDLDINLTGQLDRFGADHAGADLSQTAAFVLIGGNDFQNLDYASPTLLQDALAMVEDIVAAQIAAATALFAQGVGSVWLSELPTAAFFAEFAGFSNLEQAAAEAAFDTFNDTLAEAVTDLAGGGIDLRLAETATVTTAIAEDPTGFGLLAPYADTLLYSDAGDRFDADQIAFYDDIHPTTATHGILGAFNAHVLQGGRVLQGSDDAETLTTDSAPAPGSVVFALAGDDTVDMTGATAGTAFGGSGDDVLRGSGSGDLISGGADEDRLFGRHGDDVLAGGTGDDRSFGGQGDDVLIDTLGRDGMRGGAGDDLFIFTDSTLLGSTGTEANWIKGGAGSDTLVLVLSDATYAAVAADYLAGNDAAVTDALNLRVTDVETLELLQGRAQIATTFAGDPWFAEADVWGLV